MYYGYGYGYDSMYFLVLLAFIFSMVAQMKVSGTFKKYAKIRNKRGLTGAQVAEQMMHNAGIYDVSVQRVAGNLTDHYDPRTKTLRLSESVYDSTSVAAVGVAAQARGEQVAGDHDRPVEGERGHREYLPFKKEGGVLRRPPFAVSGCAVRRGS